MNKTVRIAVPAGAAVVIAGVLLGIFLSGDPDPEPTDVPVAADQTAVAPEPGDEQPAEPEAEAAAAPDGAEGATPDTVTADMSAADSGVADTAAPAADDTAAEPGAADAPSIRPRACVA